MRDPFLIDGPALISFSGGRTSAYMLRRILDAGLRKDVQVVFADTGKEREETYDFVRECSSRWKVPVFWVRRPGYFDKLIEDKKALPNSVQRFCTQELKLKPMWALAHAFGWEHWDCAIGIRYDEPRRLAKLRGRKPDDKGQENLFPLADARVTLADIRSFWLQQPFDLKLKEWEGNCDLCLAAETEVVTRDGIRRIGDLAGASPELLIPKLSNGSLSEVGSFVAAPVRSFGVQRLWRIELAGHGRATKEVYATAEHRWFLAPAGRHGAGKLPVVSTDDLKPGMRLRNLFRCPIGEKRGGLSRAGALRGFVFGDGTIASGQRPGRLTIHEGKDEVFLPFFAAMCGVGTEGINPSGRRHWTFYGLPDYWKKECPSLRESRHYLLGWLSGWFAADGCIAADGVCVLSSARREHLEFARSLCAVLGIQAGAVTSQVRDVTLPEGRRMKGHEIFGLRLNRQHLMSDFFWLEEHRLRFLLNAGKEERRYGWTVKSVAPTDRVEEVFCATVDGIGAFALADGLMTGNCFLKAQYKRVRIMQDRPDLAQWWIEQEKKTGRSFRDPNRPNYSDLLRNAYQPRLWYEDEEDLSDCVCGD